MAQPGPSNRQTSRSGAGEVGRSGQEAADWAQGPEAHLPSALCGASSYPSPEVPCVCRGHECSWGVGVGILTCMGREHMLVSTSFRASEYSSLPKSLVRLF